MTAGVPAITQSISQKSALPTRGIGNLRNRRSGMGPRRNRFPVLLTFPAALSLFFPGLGAMGGLSGRQEAEEPRSGHRRLICF
jgi:hypothetical protein